MNLQPSEAEAGFDMRVPPNTDLNSLEERLRKEWAPASRNLTYQVSSLNLMLIDLQQILLRPQYMIKVLVCFMEHFFYVFFKHSESRHLLKCCKTIRSFLFQPCLVRMINSRYVSAMAA